MSLPLCHWVGTLARILFCWSFPKSLTPSILLVTQCSCGWTKHRGTSSVLLAPDRSCRLKMLPPFPGCSQQLAKGLSGLPWHVQEAFGRNERQDQGLSNLQVCTYRQNPSLLECHRGTAPFCPLAAPYGSPFMPSPLPHCFPGWGMHPPVHRGKCSGERVKRFMLINPGCLFL